MSKTPRLVPMKPERLDDEQRLLYHAVLASPRGQGPTRRFLLREDGTLAGPFDAWLRSPVLGGLLERTGMALRDSIDLAPAPRELAILVVARAWNADFEWWVHSMIAAGQGVPVDVIDAIAHRRAPETDDAVLIAAHDVATEIVYDRRLQDSTAARAKDVLGERALVELVTLVGFYQLVSGVLESFHPPGPSDDLPVVGPPKLDGAG